jgi:histidinol-phosphatase (PHP family)
MIDYHIHTDYTADAKGKVEDYCKAAEEKNIEEIAFTNHFIISQMNVRGNTIKFEEIPKHLEEIELAKKKFDVKIKAGLEVDYWKSKHKEIEGTLDNYPFDFLLGSVHFIDGYIVNGSKEDALEFFKNRSMAEIYEAYFARVMETIASRLFDVLAHPDYIRKNVFKCFGKELPFEKYRRTAEKVVELLVDNNVGIEVNTSGYFHDMGDSFPSPDFLKLCLESGVKVVTIGSDAHTPSRVGDKMTEGMQKLKDVGYKKIFLFNKRKPKETRL